MMKNAINSQRSARIRRRSFVYAGRSGNAIIETALGMMVLLGLVYGMVEFGQYFFIKNAFQAAARDGTRMAILPTATQASVDTVINNTLKAAGVTTYSSSTWLTITDVALSGATTVVGSVTAVPSGDGIQIKVSTNYAALPVAFRPLYSFTAGKVGIGNKAVTGLCTMVKE